MGRIHSIAWRPKRPSKSRKELDAKIRPRVLVVDDDEDACAILSHVLAHLGYAVICISDSSVVLRHIDGESFDAMLIDLVMPGLSGFDLLRAVMSAGAHSCPVIAVSSHGELRHKAREVGFHAFVEKPVEVRKLQPVLSALLSAS